MRKGRSAVCFWKFFKFGCKNWPIRMSASADLAVLGPVWCILSWRNFRVLTFEPNDVPWSEDLLIDFDTRYTVLFRWFFFSEDKQLCFEWFRSFEVSGQLRHSQGNMPCTQTWCLQSYKVWDIEAGFGFAEVLSFCCFCEPFLLCLFLHVFAIFCFFYPFLLMLITMYSC